MKNHVEKRKEKKDNGFTVSSVSSARIGIGYASTEDQVRLWCFSAADTVNIKKQKV